MSHKKPIPSYEELHSAYTKPGATISSVAKDYDTSNPTMRKWLDHYGIDRKSHKQASTEANNRHKNNVPAREEFLEFYNNHSLQELADYYRVSKTTAREWADWLDVPLRTLSEACELGKQRQFSHIQPTEDEFLTEYNKTHHLGLTADAFGFSYSHARALVRRYGIETEKPWRSKVEVELFEFCKDLRPDLEWIDTDKSLINPFELDILCHDLKLAVEYCGLYWHSEYWGEKSRNYHRDKWQMCQDRGYQLLTIFESDDMEKVKSLLRHKCGMSTRVYARVCDLVELDSATARAFHDTYHFHGGIGAAYHYGLEYDGDLVLVASFGKSRFNAAFDYECARMTAKSGVSVIGGASKLFKPFQGHSLITYADLRYGNGAVYNHCGLEYRGTTAPNYWYWYKHQPDKLWSRVKFQKHKLSEILKDFNPEISEWENMKNNNYDRVWDCGNAVYSS